MAERLKIFKDKENKYHFKSKVNSHVDIEYKDKRLKFKLHKWDKEASIEVFLNMVEADTHKFIGNKIEIEDSRKKIRVYPIDTRSTKDFYGDATDDIQCHDGGLRYDIKYFEMPLINYYDTPLVCRNTRWGRQPFLTQEDVEQGISCPFNVEGSYPVYHATKKNNQYMTGKIGHWYRPIAIDALGNKAWCDIEVDRPIDPTNMRTTIPQQFLDEAAYPIVVDPDFGETGIGGAQQAIATDVSGTRAGSAWTMPAGGGTANYIRARINSDADDTVDCKVFINEKDSGGAGTHGQIATKENLACAAAEHWEEFTLADEALPDGVDYILNIIGNNADVGKGNNYYVKVDSVGPTAVASYIELPHSYAAPESPWIDDPAGTALDYSIYCNYTDAVTTYTKTWGIDAAFQALGIEKARGYDAAFQALGIEEARGYDAAFQATVEKARGFDAVFQATIEEARGYDSAFQLQAIEKTPDVDAAFQLQGIEKARGFDAYFAWFEATTWYAKITITDLDSVVHDIDPGVLGDGDALTLSLDHLKADDFFFSVEDYAGDKRDWLVRGCIVDIYIDRFKPPTTLRFHGMVEEVKEEWSMPAAVVVKATGRDLFSIYLERKVTETYLDTEVSLIVKDLLTIYAPALDQTNIDATTTTLEDARFPYRSLKEILDYLGTVSGFNYRCDPYLNFYWKETASEDTGIHYASSDVTNPPAKLTSLHPVKNRVFVLGGNYMQVDQEQTTTGGTKNTKDFWYAQSFIPDRSDLNQVSLHLKRTGDPANLEGEIRTDDPGNGPDEKVATFTIDKDFIELASSWRPVRVTVSLLIGVKYWIVLQKVGDGANNYEWSDDAGVAGENAFDADGVGAWTVQAASYQMAFRTHFAVPVLAVKQDYASRDAYMWREIVHEDKAIVSRVVARETAQALLDELKDLTPNIRFLRTINQTSIPDRGKLITVTMAPLKISLIQYEVKRVFFKFKGGEDGTGHMDVYLGRSIEELDEWLARLRLDIDRAKIGSFGIEEGLIPVIISIGPDAVTAGDALNLTVVASGNFRIDTARIDFSDIG